MSPGKVYCFNCFNETIGNLVVNGLPAGSIPAWSTADTTRYTPSSLTVARARRNDGRSPVFSIETPTALEFFWDSFSGRASIPPISPLSEPISLQDDLIVYLTTNQVIVLTTHGRVIRTVHVELRRS